MKEQIDGKISSLSEILLEEEIHHYLCNRFLYQKYDLSNMEQVKKLKKLLGKMAKNDEVSRNVIIKD